ncbi:uncharacterized protein LOC131255406 [Magnolia sinica]|uniref:uncharacterized protein LOC131255406 n=1 Tax=Magnolia sinica TaxID=86752 RepID=UPI002658EAC3|nr:uncharacterized protein LOC131255406 [Magnolia sinica]
MSESQHHQHRPHRISVPPRVPSSRIYPTPSYSSSSYSIPFSPSPAPTPSKQRRRTNSSSFSSIFLLLFSLRSLYSLLPFLRSSSPSFSLFPFSFLVSLLSFALSLLLSSSNEFPSHPLPSLFSSSLLRPLFTKSSLLTFVFLLRFQALRSCGTSATILADFSGTLAAKFFSEYRSRACLPILSIIRGSSCLLLSLLLLSLGWDRIGCFPMSSFSSSSSSSSSEDGDGGNCIRILPMLLPFLSGFLAFYERASANWVAFRQLGRRRVRLISLFFTTIMLFFPAIISFFFAADGDSISFGNLGWPLVNTVVFGVILSESYGDDKLMVYARDLHKDFLVTFSCTLVLELFYFDDLSLFGFLLCGFLLWLSVRDLASDSSIYPELGSGYLDTFSLMILSPIRHILSERKSRKIALFLLINTAYMVVEFVAGFMSNSLGLISDACHMLFDCAALAIGLYASYISRLPANSHFSYGRGRFEVLSGYVNAVFLVLVGALIVLESIERILDPQEISTSSLLTVSIGGLVVNVVGLIFFHEEHHHAHGGAGSCSHSHSHVDHHHHHSHDHGVHDAEHHRQGILVTDEGYYGRSGGVHNLNYYDREGAKGSSDHHDHHHHHHHQDLEDHTLGLLKNSAMDCSLHDSNPHDHSDHRQGQHGHDHEYDSHDHHMHGHKHDHHIHSRQNDHHQRPDDQQDPQGHGHQSVCHNNQCHSHHHHDRPQHFLQSSGGLEHAHQSPITVSTGSDNHSHEGHNIHGDSSAHKGGCCNKDNPNHSHISNHAPKSDSNKDSLEEKVHAQPRKHHHIDHNMEGIFLHVLADTMGSVGVVISTLLIKYKGWLVADPACSIFISVLIVSSVVSLLRNSAEILLQRVPRAHEQDLRVALDDVMRIKGVHSIQNMHVWSFTNMDVVGTFHLQVSAEIDKASTKEKVSQLLRDAGIKDLTLQVE